MPQDLGTLGGASSRANAINGGGEIVGTAQVAAGGYRAFVWRNGVMSELAAPGTLSAAVANGINDFGQVVGRGNNVGMLWNNGAGSDLNTLLSPSGVWNVYDALDINNAGQILAHGSFSGGGQQHVLLLTPVPEPASLSLFALGGSVIICRIWRRCK